MKNLCFATILSFISFTVCSQTVLLEEGFQNGIPATWSVFDLDGQTPDSSISYINEAWVGFESAFDTCAVSTSYYTNTAERSMDYLVTPKVDLLSFGHLLSWESKSFDANFLESYYVLLSTTDSLPESFTDTIVFINEDSPNWKTRTVNLFVDGFADQSVYIAFQNASTNAFILGVDNVKLTTNDVASVTETEKNEISVFPNPVVDQLTVNAPNGTSYELFDIDGRFLKSGTVQDAQVDFTSLKPSIYFLSLETSEYSQVKRIVKQ